MSTPRGLSRTLPCFLFLLSIMRLLPAATAFTVEHRDTRFDVYRLDKGEEQDLEFFWKRPDGTPYATIRDLRQALASEGRSLVFAVNGGIFSTQFTPLGLYIEKGKRHYQINRGQGGGNFFLAPNGVFYITEHGARVVETEDYAPRDPVVNAVQSGPILVSGGGLHPRFIPGYHSKHIRHGVGVDGEGRVVFAISKEPVNFHDFGTLFRDGLSCPDALYLDGSISQMYAPELGRDLPWASHRFTTILGLARPGPTPASSGAGQTP